MEEWVINDIEGSVLRFWYFIGGIFLIGILEVIMFLIVMVLHRIGVTIGKLIKKNILKRVASPLEEEAFNNLMLLSGGVSMGSGIIILVKGIFYNAYSETLLMVIYISLSVILVLAFLRGINSSLGYEY